MKMKKSSSFKIFFSYLMLILESIFDLFVIILLFIAIVVIAYLASKLQLKTLLTSLLGIEVITIFFFYFYKEKLLFLIDTNFGLNYFRLRLYYWVITLSLVLPLITLINLIYPISLLLNFILISFFLVIWGYFVKNNDQLFAILINKYYREKVGFHEINWHSEKFEKFVGEDLVELYIDTQKLVYEMRNKKDKYKDYSFIVFPLAKAYEGVLKKILVEMNFITKAQLLSDPGISINLYFNPVGNKKIFAALKDKARDKAIPHVIYATYSECRNQILHYDPYRDNRLKTVEEADFFIRRIIDAIDKAYVTFKR